MHTARSLLYRGSPWTETPWTETPRTETSGQRPPGQKSPGQRFPWTENPPVDRQTPVKTLPSQNFWRAVKTHTQCNRLSQNFSHFLGGKSFLFGK